MGSLIKIALVGAGVWAANRVYQCSQWGIPWDLAFNNPWLSMPELLQLRNQGGQPQGYNTQPGITVGVNTPFVQGSVTVPTTKVSAQWTFNRPLVLSTLGPK